MSLTNNLPSNNLPWLPESFNQPSLCFSNYELPFLSNPLFCTSKNEPLATYSSEPMGILTRAWKAFKMTIGMNSLTHKTEKQQWHEHVEKLAEPEEANIQVSMHEIHQRLSSLQRQKDALGGHITDNELKNIESVSYSLNLLWERHWSFARSCNFGTIQPGRKQWCDLTSQALKKDSETLESKFHLDSSHLLFPFLEKSKFAKFKKFFEKNDLKVSPELLLASNTHLLKNDFEVNPLSQQDLLTQILVLFDQSLDIPEVVSLKKALSCAQEMQKQVIIPFRNYIHALDYKKYTGLKGMESRFNQATERVRKIISSHLNEKSRVIIPGGLSGSNGAFAKLAPHLIKGFSRWLKDKQVGLPDLTDVLKKAESWIFSASQIAFYEIEPDSKGTYTFRIYYGHPNEAHPEEINNDGKPYFQSSVSMSGINKEALLSDAILRTLVETQLVGDLVREISSFTLDFLPPEKEKIASQFSKIPTKEKNITTMVYETLNATQNAVIEHATSVAGAARTNLMALGTSFMDTLLSIGGGKQASWDIKKFEDSLFTVLGGKMEKKNSANQIEVMTSSSADWDALSAVIKQIGSAEDSERLLLSTKLALLHHFCKNTSPEDLGSNEQMLSILFSAQQSLARWSLSKSSNLNFDNHDMQVIHQIVFQAKQLINRAKDVEALRLKKEAAFIALKDVPLQQPFGSTKLEAFKAIEQTNFKVPDVIYRPIDKVIGWEPQKSNWTSDLHDFSELFLKQIDEGNLLAVIDAVELLAEQSENLLSLIKKIPQKDVEPTITSISEIARAHYIAHFDENTPIHSDARGFATSLVWMELGEELRKQLPKEYSLSEVTLYGDVFDNYLTWKSALLTPMGFRLYDQAWDRRIQRIAEKNTNRKEFSGFLSHGRNDRFGAADEKGIGFWRYRNIFTKTWPLGLEAFRIESAYPKDFIFDPLFDTSLPYNKTFNEKFPDLVNEDRLAKIAAAYEDPSESCLPKAFYRLRELATLPRYFLRSPFFPVEGPVKGRQSYNQEFHAVHIKDVTLPSLDVKNYGNWNLTNFYDWNIKIYDKRNFYFSEVYGINSEFLNAHPEIRRCDTDFMDCHRFIHTHDPYKNEVLKSISIDLGGDQRIPIDSYLSESSFRRGKTSIKYSNHGASRLKNDNFNINQAMIQNVEVANPGGLDWKDFVRLRAIFSHKTTQVLSAASFFSNHFDLFEGDEKKEWRSLLLQAFFDPGLLIHHLMIDSDQRKDVIRALDFFCYKGYRYFHSLQKHDDAAFFLEISLMLTNYVDQTRTPDLQDPFDLKMLRSDKLTSDLREITSSASSLHEREKGPMAGVLAKHLLEGNKIYSQQELSEIIENVMLYYRYPSSGNLESRQRRDAIVKGMRRIAPQVKRLMSDESKRNALLKKWIARVEPSSLETPIFAIDTEGLRYISERKDLVIDLLEGRLLKTGLGDQTLPFEVLGNSFFSKIFGNLEPLVTLLSTNSWEFIDQSGYRCRINKQGKEIQILREIKENKWYRYVPAEQFIETPMSPMNRQFISMQELDDRTTPFGSLQLTMGHTHWYSEDFSELLLLDAKTDQPHYRVSLIHSLVINAIGGKDLLHAVEDLSSVPHLKLINIYNERSRFAWLENMDDLRHVMLWGDNETGELKRIELPRYRRFREVDNVEGIQNDQAVEGLSFTVKDGKAYCDQIPDFYLEPRQYSDQLPHIKSLLAVRNAKGDQKIILPYWEPLAQAGLSMYPIFQDPRSNGILQHTYVVLERGKGASHFAGTDIQSNLYQALMLQTQHRYTEAAEVLARHGHFPKAYSPQQRQVYESIIKFAISLSRDEQPDAFIPAMQAIVMFIKDHMAHGSSIESIEKSIKPIFLTYYKNKESGSYFGVSTEDIALVARYLLEKENQFGGDLKEEYLRHKEHDQIAAHRALSDYVFSSFSKTENVINNGMDLFKKYMGNLFPSEEKSPYEFITAISEKDLSKLMKSALSSKNAILTTGISLQPDEEEFALKFLDQIKLLPNASQQTRKSMMDHCLLLQSKHSSVNALSQMLMVFLNHPETLVRAIGSLDMDIITRGSKINAKMETAIDNLIFNLVKGALQHASKEVVKQQSSNENDYSDIFNFISRMQKPLQFDPEKFASSDAYGKVSNQSLPLSVQYGSLINGWQQLLIKKEQVSKVDRDPGLEGYRKIFDPFVTQQLSQRNKEESIQMLDSIEEYLRQRQGIWEFKDSAARENMIMQKEALKDTIVAHERDLTERELAILAFFNRPSKDKQSSIKADLKQMGGQTKSHSMLELILLFARKELHLFKQNSDLSSQDIQLGSRLIANYLTVAKRRDSLKNELLPLIDKLSSFKSGDFGSFKENELINDLAARLQAKPQVDPEEQPEVSGFEYFNHLLIRGEQWEKIDELQQFFIKAMEKVEGAPRHLVQKLEMGFGKTFVLTTIQAFIAADGKHLSMGLMPKELIEDMSKEISGILGNSFGQLLQRLDFDRNTEFSVKRLENIYHTLTHAINHRMFLMMTPQSERSFYLKFLETWDSYAAILKNPDAEASIVEECEQKIRWMQKILMLWKEANVIFDEKDLILNPKQRLSFAMGQSRSLAMMYPERIGLTVELYRVLTSPAFNEKVKLGLEFFDVGTKNVKKTFTELYYKNTVKPALAEMMLDRLTQKVQYNDEISSFAKRFSEYSELMKNWSSKELELVKSFLLNQDATGEGIHFIKNQKNEKLSQVLALLKGQLNELLPLTLNRNYSERYGFHRNEDILAGPYSGSNTPNLGSQFTDPWEIAMYTIQAHLKRGDYQILITQIVENARKQAKKEKLTRGCSLDETDAYRNFEQMIGKKCKNKVHLFQGNAIEAISEAIKTDISFQLFLIEQFILPEINEFPVELSATSQVFSLLHDVTKGFTGTPWNWQTYPIGTKVSAITSTDGATLVPLYKKSSDRVFEVTSTKENKVASLFDKNPSFRDAQAFIDSGGIFKGIPHEEVARNLFTLTWFRDAFDGVIFFDEKGNKKMLEESSRAVVSADSSNIPMSRHFTFYDQKHSTGTNIKQMPEAKGVTSVSKQMILRDLMQAVKRFREFHKAQKMDIVIHSDDAPFIKEILNLSKDKTLTFNHVISYLWKQQLGRMGEENFVAAGHKMEAKLQQPLFELMRDPSSDLKGIAKWYPKSRTLFFKEIEDNPLARYGEPKKLMPKEYAMDMKIKELLKPEIASLFLNNSPLNFSSQDKLKAWILSSVNATHLDHELPISVGSHDHETEMELEKEVEQEEEIEQEIEQQMEEELEVNTERMSHEHQEVVKYILLEFNNYEKSIPLYKWTGRYAHRENFYDNSILVSKNQMNSFFGAHETSSQRIYKPVEYVLIHVTKDFNGQKKYALTLIDTNDAADAERAFLKFKNKISSEEGWILYSLGVGQVAHIGLEVEERPGHEEPALLSLLVQAKFADGEIYYTENEQKFLEEWIRKVGVDKAESEIKYLLRDQPTRRNAYSESTLGALIQKIKGKI
jgi:hypothetical protein